MAFDLEHGGSLTTYAPGADDRRVPGAGRWRLEGSSLVLEPEGQPAQRLAVIEAAPDRLVVRRAD
jgi:hypothetical protein